MNIVRKCCCCHKKFSEQSFGFIRASTFCLAVKEREKSKNIKELCGVCVERMKAIILILGETRFAFIFVFEIFLPIISKYPKIHKKFFRPFTRYYYRSQGV